MTTKVVFLSHIHEEKPLAVMVKAALEDEFSGFVDVFVSSDGTSIPAGANFLKRIEDGLLACVGALYLISPASAQRHWVSFELGAVWVRNATGLRTNNVEIPILPLCHSGMVPADLPAPLNNLNASSANQSSDLELAFRSLQAAVGGKGRLKTDFQALATRVASFESEYTLGASLAQMFNVLKADVRSFVAHCEHLDPRSNAVINADIVPDQEVRELTALAKGGLNGYIRLIFDGHGQSYRGDGRVITGEVLKIEVPVSLVMRYKRQLIG